VRIYKYMSVEVAPKFAESLKIRFTQPFEQNDPFEFRPMLDSVGTANDVRDQVESNLDEKYGTIDGAFAMLEKQMATDPKFPKLSLK
jgi:hypothetical protein